MHPIGDVWSARRMVEEQIIPRGVTDAKVLAVMSALPREPFVLDEYRDQAYADQPLPIGYGQTISQPYVVAWMTEALEVRPDDRVLEVGTGSGYQAAVLGKLAAEVFSIERVPTLADSARKTLASLGIDNVSVTVGDGSLGLPDAAPFDAIVMSAAAPEVPPALLGQLVPDGRVVAPIGPPAVQALLVLRRRPDGTFSVVNRGECVFVPLV